MAAPVMDKLAIDGGTPVIQRQLNRYKGAAAIGDDRLQMQTKGYIVPESFTHGTAEQRWRWFKKGLDSGSVPACDTFKAANP